ncbi:MAG TPA: class I SAM-dependent methyltransferase [Candidatus Krumholzibacteria bacterium]|nr:class I SAM-dependent methyltransferase [Candidatus Krumholzibacteria bacterium]
MERKQHWENQYNRRELHEVSWFQSRPDTSLALIEEFLPDKGAALIDVGGGGSTLVDGLLAAGYRSVTILDWAAAGLAQAQSRLGEAASRVTWLQADVLGASLQAAHYALWHDRAVFHFLVAPAERSAYVQRLRAALHPSGHAIIATFAPEGPERCSGLPVRRYTPEELAAELGEPFHLVTWREEQHRTPAGVTQPFQFSVFEHRGSSAGSRREATHRASGREGEAHGP